MQTNKYLTITAIVMLVNNLAFVVTYGRERDLIMEFTPTRMAIQLACNLKRIIYLYVRDGFVIQTILIDMEFDKIIPEIPEVAIYTIKTCGRC